MRKIINKLREQPEQHRKHILHLVTFILGICLFLIWVYTLSA